MARMYKALWAPREERLPVLQKQKHLNWTLKSKQMFSVLKEQEWHPKERKRCEEVDAERGTREQRV